MQFKHATVAKKLREEILLGVLQEWNVSRPELDVLSELGLLSPEAVEKSVASAWNPVRVGFKGAPDLWVDDVLNIGVDPR